MAEQVNPQVEKPTEKLPEGSKLESVDTRGKVERLELGLEQPSEQGQVVPFEKPATATPSQEVEVTQTPESIELARLERVRRVDFGKEATAIERERDAARMATRTSVLRLVFQKAEEAKERERAA